MSTNSTIVLHLKDEDMGKEIKFNPNLLPMLEDGTRKGYIDNYPIPSVQLEGRYMEVYHHWDGYVEGLGYHLVTEFNTYEKILNLLSMGDLSTCIGKEVCSYNGWRNENVAPTFYVQEPSCSEEYIYLFVDGRWYYKDDYEVHEWTDVAEKLGIEMTDVEVSVETTK